MYILQSNDSCTVTKFAIAYANLCKKISRMGMKCLLCMSQSQAKD